MAAGPKNPPRIAIVGASSLRGKELKQVLEDRNFPTSELMLLDASVQAPVLTEAAGEPTFIRSLAEDSFDGARFVYFAGNALEASQNWPIAQRAGATVIDLTGAVTVSGQAVTWIPSLASEIAPRLTSSGSLSADASAPPDVYFSPSAPVIIACTVSVGLGKYAPQRVAILLFPPVSERGQLGIEELENQSRNLLSFREIGPSSFDAQVAFNLLKNYGEESKPRLEDIRKEISRDVGLYLSGRAPVPAIQLVQAPVFYGYAFAAYAEFGAAVPSEQIEASLATLGVKIGAAGDPVPSNISFAGENEIQISHIETDPGVANGVWIWGVADNLRLPAVNAVRIAEELVGTSAAR